MEESTENGDSKRMHEKDTKVLVFNYLLKWEILKGFIHFVSVHEFLDIYTDDRSAW